MRLTDFRWVKAAIECRFCANCRFIENHLGESEMQDEDGYPTEIALEVIRRWPWTKKKELFDFIKAIWFMPSFGWNEEVTEEATTYYISTAGWSGNESVIQALKEAEFIWSFTWVQSRRGGHYIFEIKHEDTQ